VTRALYLLGVLEFEKKKKGYKKTAKWGGGKKRGAWLSAHPRCNSNQKKRGGRDHWFSLTRLKEEGSTQKVPLCRGEKREKKKKGTGRRQALFSPCITTLQGERETGTLTFEFHTEPQGRGRERKSVQEKGAKGGGKENTEGYPTSIFNSIQKGGGFYKIDSSFKGREKEERETGNVSEDEKEGTHPLAIIFTFGKKEKPG